jgi:DNA-binding transcriptional regulator YiaG
MVRKKTLADLEPWLEHAHSSLIASFAAGVLKEHEAVRAAVSLPWSNGQTEGQITKLKLVRRQMYGRGKIGLLQARVIGAQCSAAPPKLRQTQFCTPDHTQALNGAEVRFLRLEMNTTQKNLAAFLGVEQAVRRWEKARTKPVTNDPADSLVRAVYAEYVNKKSDVYRIIQRLTDLDQIEPTSGRLFETDKGWRQEECVPCLRSTPAPAGVFYCTAGAKAYAADAAPLALAGVPLERRLRAAFLHRQLTMSWVLGRSGASLPPALRCTPKPVSARDGLFLCLQLDR